VLADSPNSTIKSFDFSPFALFLMISNLFSNEMALRLRTLIIQPIVIEKRKNRNKERTEIIFLGRAYHHCEVAD